MPAFYTHYTFVEKNSEQKDKYARIRGLGGQGPDVFFFYGHSLGKRENKAKIRDFGTYLHHTNISSAYNFLLEYSADKEDKKMLHAYIKGLFMHYVLDRNCHPYVFFRTGFPTSENPTDKEKEKYMNYHVRFESILDTIYGKLNNTFKSSGKCAKCPDVQVKSVSKMFYELAKFLNYEGIEELTYYNAYKDMLFVESVLYSPLGVKKFLVHNIFARNKNIDCMMSPSSTKAFEKYDILNLQHSRWFDCVSGAERRESFFDLVDKAREELLTVDTIIRKSYRGDNVKRDITKFVDNIDHDGFEVGAKKLHYQVFSDLRDTK